MTSSMKAVLVLGCLWQSATANPPAPPAPKKPSNAQIIFNNQLLLNMQVGVIVSPRADDSYQWLAETGWDSDGTIYSSGDPLPDETQISALFILIEITPDLLQAATKMWASDRKISDEAKKEALNRLSRMYCREKLQSFLLVVKPIARCGFKSGGLLGEFWSEGDGSLWRLNVGPVQQNLILRSLDGLQGKVIRCEDTCDEPLTSQNQYYSCLVFVDNSVVRGDDPLYSIELGNIRYDIREAKYGKAKYGWIRNRTPYKIKFRFEIGKVHLLAMFEAGVPWKSIEEKYLGPKRQLLNSKFGEYGIQFLIGVAQNIASALVLRPLGL